jgi:SAM-dependent methyltransferase
MSSEVIVVSHGVPYDTRLESSRNVFADVFGQQSPEEWGDTVIASLTHPSIAGVEFPTFPSPEFQNALHGHSGEHSLREALAFYNFVTRYGLAGPRSPAFGQGYMLDFGAGWGRITRLFMRDFPLKHIIGFEPHGTFCTVARAHNPFVSFVAGDALPPTMLVQGRFDLAVGWSVMSHLSERSATAWLREFGRILATGGSVVLTTWGLRFLEQLKREEQMAAEGQDIHFYSRICIDAAGNLDDRIAEYNDGRFVWFDSGQGALYGEACLSERALRRMLADNDISLSLELFDTSSLVQDAFILKRV